MLQKIGIVFIFSALLSAQSFQVPSRGGGTGVPNPSNPVAGASTTQTVDITSLKINTLNSAIPSCKTANSIIIPTSIGPVGSNPITGIVFTYPSTVGVTCTVNSNGGAGATGAAGANGGPGATGAAGAAGAAGAPGAAATVGIGTVSTGAPGSAANVTNGGTNSAATFIFTIPRGDAGPSGPPGATGGPGSTGAAGASGTPGVAASVGVGTISTGTPGSPVSVTNTGSNSAAILNFTIPRGDVGPVGATGAGTPGAPGAAATVGVGTVSTGTPGSSAAVTNGGSTSAASLNFVIPRGDIGPIGATGNPGTSGAAASVNVGAVVTGAPGSSVSVTNGGSISAATLNFTIPRGDVGPVGATGAGTPGAPGAAATVGIGTVSTGAPGSSVIVTNTGSSSAAAFNFTIPAGSVGPAGATGITTGAISATLRGISTGLQACSAAPWDGTVIGPWTISDTDAVGSLVVDIWKGSFSTSVYPTSANTIVASSPPTLTGARNATGPTTGWITGFLQNDLICFSVTSVSGLTKATVSYSVTHLGGGGGTGGGGIGITTGDTANAGQAVTVIGIQNRPMAATLPANNQVIGYNASLSRWEPQTPSAGAGGASSVSQLSDLRLDRTSNNLVTFNPGNIMINGIVYGVAIGTIGVTGGSGIVSVGVDISVNPPIGKIYFQNTLTGTSCTGMNGCTTPTVGVAFGNDDYEVGTWSVTNGTFDATATGYTSLRGLGGRNRTLAGAGLLSNYSAFTQTISLDPAHFQILNLAPGTGTVLVSGTTITPNSRQHHVSGTTPIATITATGMVDGETLILIADGGWSTTTGGNIGRASTAVVGQAVRFFWDLTAAKWYPGF